jgi:hypothetical protein
VAVTREPTEPRTFLNTGAKEKTELRSEKSWAFGPPHELLRWSQATAQRASDVQGPLRVLPAFAEARREAKYAFSLDWYSWVGSNRRPPDPQSGALTN